MDVMPNYPQQNITCVPALITSACVTPFIFKLRVKIHKIGRK